MPTQDRPGRTGLHALLTDQMLPTLRALPWRELLPIAAGVAVASRSGATLPGPVAAAVAAAIVVVAGAMLMALHARTR